MANPVSTDTACDDLESRERTETNCANGEKTSQTVPKAKDPDIVDWDGPADPANPRNWNQGTKLAQVIWNLDQPFYLIRVSFR